MVRTNPDGRPDGRTHSHTLKCRCDSITGSGLDKKRRKLWYYILRFLYTYCEVSHSVRDGAVVLV